VLPFCQMNGMVIAIFPYDYLPYRLVDTSLSCCHISDHDSKHLRGHGIGLGRRRR